MSEHDELWSVGKAALALGVSTRTILRWTEAGKLPLAGYSEGGHRRYNAADVVALKAGAA